MGGPPHLARALQLEQSCLLQLPFLLHMAPFGLFLPDPSILLLLQLLLLLHVVGLAIDWMQITPRTLSSQAAS
jgi:hypothetical protein